MLSFYSPSSMEQQQKLKGLTTGVTSGRPGHCLTRPIFDQFC